MCADSLLNPSRAFGSFSHGFEGNNYLTGLEYQLGSRVEVRGAGRVSQNELYPSAGAGVNLTRNFGVEAAVFGTKTFLEPDDHVGLVISFRIGKR